jgi:hypothetical protein
MRLAPPSVYYCPSCNKPLLKKNRLSYTFHKGTTWSDGWRSGYPDPTPDPAKCPHCAEVFFLSGLIEHKDIPYEEYYDYKYLSDPDLADYIKVVRQELAETEYDKIETRIRLWKTFNDKIRRGECINDGEMKIWQDNCEKLLSIKEQKRKEKMKAIQQTPDPMKNHYDLTEITRLKIEIAELKRNLGRFDECLKDLESFPNSFDWLKEQFAEKCRAKDTMVFKIRNREEQ